MWMNEINDTPMFYFSFCIFTWFRRLHDGGGVDTNGIKNMVLRVHLIETTS